MIKTDIGKNIYEMRVFRNIDKKDLAKNCGVDIETVSKWESGDIIPSAVELFAIAKALNTTADYFSVDLDKDKEYRFFSSDSDALLTVALTTMSTAKNVNPLRKMMLNRTAIEELVNLKLMTLNTPQYSLARTTEKQRRDAISCSIFCCRLSAQIFFRWTRASTSSSHIFRSFNYFFIPF